METNLVTAKNGIKILFIDLPGIPSGTVQAWYKAGSALEDSKHHGVAHFLEHMFFKGTPKRPGSNIARDVEAYGGEINAFTSFDYTCYYINSPQTHINKSVEILMDMVSNPSFLESELIPERGVVVEEYRRSQDNPNQFAFQLLQKNIFKHNYGHPILGTEKDITRFSRKQIMDFRKKFYTRENFMLIVAGDLRSNKNKLLKQVEKYSMPKGKENSFPAFELNQKEQHLIHSKDVSMANLTFVTDGLALANDLAPAEDLAISCLGLGESSRLYKSLVSSGSTASRVSASTLFMNNGSSHFIKFIYPHENHKELLVKVYDTLKDLFENGFNEDEIDRIKGQYIASKVYEKEHIESMAFSLGYGFAQYNDLDGDKKFIEKVQNTTLEQVNNAFKNILSKVIHSNQQISHNQKSAAFEKETKDFFKKLAKLVKVKSPKKKSVKHTRSSFDPSVSYINLPNNNKLIYRHNPMTPTFVLQAYIQGGLSAETNKNNGAFNLISSLLPTGYDKINRQQLKKSLEEKSASLHGFSGKNAYGLMMHGQTKDYSELSEMFFSSLLRPSFANKELAHEKEIVKRSIQAFNDEPSRILFQKISKTFFMDHPYARTPLGTLAGQKVLTRKFLKNLHDQQVSSGSIVFTMCGDIPVEKVLATIESLDLPKARAKSIKTMPKKFKPKLVAEHKHTHMDREQTHLFYGIPTEGISNKYHLSLKVLTSFLSGQSSELFTDVRDKKGLCYVAQPIHFNALEAGYWGIYMASTPSKVELAVKSLDGIISKLTKKGMSKSTFNKVKVMMRGQNQINIQTNEDYAGVYSVPVLQGLGLDYFHRGNEQIDALTLEQFNKDLRSLFKQGLALFTVGNHEN